MSRYFLPGSYPYSFACLPVVGAHMHPMLQRLLGMAPDRAEVLAFVNDAVQIPEEHALQQAGGQMLRVFVQTLPASYKERAKQLEALFRVMVDHAFSQVIKLRAVPELGIEPENTAAHAMVMAYVAVQQVVGARCMAMELYNS